MLHDNPDVHEHAYGDEKEAGEAVSEGQHLCHGLMAILGLGDDQPCDEGPDCQRQAGQGRQPGDAQAQ